MSETFLNKAQLTGLTKDARRTEILRAKATAALDDRVTALESGGGGLTLEQVQDDLGNTSLIAGTSLTKTYNDGAGTITLDVDSSDFAGSGHAHCGVYQPLDSDLTTIAAANNGAILAATTASFTTADETKLDGLAASARFVSTSLPGPISTAWFDNSLNGAAHGTLAGAANRIEMSPVVFPTDLTVDTIAARCTTGVAASTIKLVVYSSTSAGWPDALIKETAALSTATSNTTQSEAWSYTFLAGVVYWVGIRHSATATMRAVPVGATPSLGLGDATAASQFTTVRRTLAYATPATDPWAFVSGDRTSNIAPTSIRFRAA